MKTIDNMSGNHHQTIKASDLSSPATEALDYILQSESVDPTSLIFDLNDLLRRDPTLSSLNSNIKQEIQTISGVPIPKRMNNDILVDDLLSTTASSSDVIAGTGANTVVNNPPSIPYGSSYGSGSLGGGNGTSPSMFPVKMELESSNTVMMDPLSPAGITAQHTFYNDKQQPTLAQLNSPPADQDINLLKYELNEFNWDTFFTNDDSKNVTLMQTMKPVAPVVSPPPPTQPHQSGSMIKTELNADSLLSSSVPASIFHNSPLGDILPDFNPTSPPQQQQQQQHHHQQHHQQHQVVVSPSATVTSGNISRAGPERVSTLHKLLMQQNRPSPVRSPESRNNPKTLGQMKSSLLSASNPLLSQQLSKSAPSQHSAYLDRLMWARREPRPHINSVCSVGGDSSVADEVSDVLNGLSPTDLPDIASDDENEDDMSLNNESDDEELSDDDDESDKKDGKKERHFWQYNVQAKGPKGQKIVVETKIEDPHELNEIVDPVFSGDVQLQGIKHSGKARRGDGNDLTANPKKLAAIGKELDQLSKVINDLTPVSEMPFGARCKSRKEKNKLASRACRLKKKAQHEANKVKCCGLRDEHHMLLDMIKKAKIIMKSKVDPANTIPQEELTAEVDMMAKKMAKGKVAGDTTGFVNRQIDKYST